MSHPWWHTRLTHDCATPHPFVGFVCTNRLGTVVVHPTGPGNRVKIGRINEVARGWLMNAYTPLDLQNIARQIRHYLQRSVSS